MTAIVPKLGFCKKSPKVRVAYLSVKPQHSAQNRPVTLNWIVRNPIEIMECDFVIDYYMIPAFNGKPCVLSGCIGDNC